MLVDESQTNKVLLILKFKICKFLKIFFLKIMVHSKHPASGQAKREIYISFSEILPHTKNSIYNQCQWICKLKQ